MDEFLIDNYKVYIRLNEDSAITDVNSSAFLSDLAGYIEIDEGMGDKYHHAQGNYLEKGLFDEFGCYNYKLVDGAVIERATEEKQAELILIQNMREIAVLKEQLTETDYKIIKCSEYQLTGLEMPYDIAVLHTERQTLRDRINELEITLS